VNWTRSEVAALLKERGIRPKKALGQNFLVDANFLDAIVRDAEVGPEDGVIEIGTGLGSLTARLADRAGHVWSFEIDPTLRGLAEELLAGKGNVTLVGADGAEFGSHVDASRTTRLKVVSNLPYCDWQRLALALLSTPLTVERYVLMLQRDVADRLRARPGTRDYGPVPALVQASADLKVFRKAAPELFYPSPRVESTVLQLVRKIPPMDLVAAEKRLRLLFAHRRKKCPEAGGRRIETLSPPEILSILRP
jgi:16S rRNA (adenine1518-N6/adenine1519-N6)-dimethyltransferase